MLPPPSPGTRPAAQGPWLWVRLSSRHCKAAGALCGPTSLPLFVMPTAGMRSLVGLPCKQQLGTRTGGAPRPAHVQAKAAAAVAVREVKAAVGRLQPALEGHEARHGGLYSTCILDLPVEHRRGFFTAKVKLGARGPDQRGRSSQHA